MTENELSDKQRQALTHFVSCASIERGCKEAGISRESYYRWLENPLFKKELDSLREQSMSEAVDGLKYSMKVACQTLVSLCDDIECPHAVRRGAASDIISHVMKWREIQEIETRLEALERLTAQRQT